MLKLCLSCAQHFVGCQDTDPVLEDLQVEDGSFTILGVSTSKPSKRRFFLLHLWHSSSAWWHRSSPALNCCRQGDHLFLPIASAKGWREASTLSGSVCLYLWCTGIFAQMLAGNTPPTLLSTLPLVTEFLVLFYAPSAKNYSGIAPWAGPYIHLSHHLLNGCLTLSAWSWLKALLLCLGTASEIFSVSSKFQLQQSCLPLDLQAPCHFSRSP